MAPVEIYLNIDDLNKKEAPVYVRKGRDAFVRTGGTIKRKVSEAQVRATQERLAREEEQRKIETQRKQEELKKQQAEAKEKRTAKEKLIRTGRALKEGTKQTTRDIVVATGSKIRTEASKPYSISVGLPQGPISRKITKGRGRFEIARSDVAKEQLEKGGFGARSLSYVYPSTRGELFGTLAVARGITLLPPAGQSTVGVLYGASAVGTITTQPGLPKEQKTALAVTGGLGFLGGVYTIKPFLKPRQIGAKKPVTQEVQPGIGQKLFGKTRETFTNVKTRVGNIDIGIVPRGRGFGFTQPEQQALVGKEVTLTTGARGLVGTGQEKVTATQDIFFVPTPTETGGGLRISRIGLMENPFKRPKSDELVWQQAKPQAVVEPKTQLKSITPGTELETTYPKGTTIYVQPRGAGVVEGQKLNIFEIVGAKGKGLITGVTRGPSVKELPSTTTQPQGTTPYVGLTPRVRGTQSTSPIEEVSPRLFSVSTPTAQTTSVTAPTLIAFPTTPQPYQEIATIPLTSTRTGGGGSGTSYVPPPPTEIIPPPTRGYGGGSPRITPPRTPTYTTELPSLGVPVGKKKRRPLWLGDFVPKKKSGGAFPVEVRRFGKFKTIGFGRTSTEAISLGRERVATGLGATFRVKGAGKLRTPPGFRRGKEIGTFIEKRKFRLSTGGEIKAIQRARRRK